MYFGGSVGSHVIKVSSVESLIDLYLRSYISFDNLALQGANAKSFGILNSNNITINACDISFSGQDAVKSNSECNNIAVTNCNISYSNFNGIVASGSSAWTITGNTIRNTAAVAGMGGTGEGQYFGIRDVGNNSAIKNNTIINTGYVPISFQGTNVTVENNFIDTFCTVKDDGGGIYFGGYSFKGSKVVGNIILNGIGISQGTPDKDLRAHGIYADDGASNVEIGNNTAAFNGNSGIYNHGSYDLSIHDNTLFDNKVTAVKYYNDKNTINNITLTGNIFFAKTTSQLTFRSSGGSANPRRFFVAADNNYWCRPLNDKNNIETSSGSYNLAGWKSFTGKEASSRSCPVPIRDIKKIRFEYNPTAFSRKINLMSDCLDVKGKKYSGIITLPPYTSVILIDITDQ
jgi:parallel beta-helix repeat protein